MAFNWAGESLQVYLDEKVFFFCLTATPYLVNVFYCSVFLQEHEPNFKKKRRTKVKYQHLASLSRKSIWAWFKLRWSLRIRLNGPFLGMCLSFFNGFYHGRSQSNLHLEAFFFANHWISKSKFSEHRYLMLDCWCPQIHLCFSFFAGDLMGIPIFLTVGTWI